MSSPKYDPIDLSQDATRFANSRFGKHYLARLERLKTVHLTAAMKVDFTDSYRAHRASKAAAIDSELEFFRIARTIQESPSLLKRLRKKLLGREEEANDEDV